MATAANNAKMLPYHRQGEIDYAGLEFDPDTKHLTLTRWNRTVK